MRRALDVLAAGIVTVAIFAAAPVVVGAFGWYGALLFPALATAIAWALFRMVSWGLRD